MLLLVTWVHPPQTINHYGTTQVHVVETHKDLRSTHHISIAISDSVQSFQILPNHANYGTASTILDPWWYNCYGLYLSYTRIWCRLGITASWRKVMNWRWRGNKMDFDLVPSLWWNKPVQLNKGNPGELVKIHLITVMSTKVPFIIFRQWCIAWYNYPFTHWTL